MSDTYILKDAEKLAGGHYRIANDPYGIRKGYVFRAFSSEKDIIDTFSPLFSETTIGFCDDNFYGIRQKVWIITAKKK